MPPIKDMTEFETSLLTEEERSAIEDDEEEGGKEKPVATGTPDDPVTEMEPDDDEDAPQAGDKPAEAAPAGDEPAAKPAVEEPVDEAAPRRESTTFVMPEGEARDYGTELAAVAKKFEDGEISTAEFANEQAAILRAQTRAEVARDINDAQWQRDVRRFLRDNEQYASSKVLYSALNAALEEVGAKPENSSLDGDELLALAHKTVSKEFGLAPAAKTGGRPLPRPGEAEVKAMARAPKTLAEVPTADDSAPGSDKFASIDRLSGLELEQALAKMSDADADAYLSMRD